ncbi:MAG: SusC/RagA family TonB-linked outer membrane protein [Bacteroidaceae bacterium]|nr:SusC/RagA family TonB-linked outer membrane protein [Bacteroidaceae bacterium]
MKNKSIVLFAILLIAFVWPSKGETLKGFVCAPDNSPLPDVVITSSGVSTVTTDTDGAFSIDLSADAIINVWADGYYSQTIRVDGRTELKIVLVPIASYKYNETAVLPFRIVEGKAPEGTDNVTKKDFALGSSSIDKAIQGELTGLQVTNKSGMTGEGAYMALHGIQTLASDNMPLIVVNGVPFMPSPAESQLIGGYSRSVFRAFNINDIQNITLLKGAEASLYGSLASNGVILIETDGATSDDMNTKISYDGSFGTNWKGRSLPLMNASEYKSYLSDIGMTYYNNMETFFNDFSFLSPDEGDAFNYLYQYDTDWQSILYQNGITTDHLVRVEGGDAIAKYDVSLGYMRDEGSVKDTYSDRFHTQINSNVLVSKKLEIGATIGLAYINGQYQEQGLSLETNPLLAAYRRAPVLSPYKSDMYGNLLETYAGYRFGNISNTDFIVSNPMSIIGSLSATQRQYDVNMRANLTYKPTNNLQFSGIFGLYYNYDQEGVFIPGINNSDIVPQFDSYGSSENIVRQGVNEQFNMFYSLNGAYNNVWNGIHALDFRAGAQTMMTSYEADMGVGRNTANDFYQTLSDVQSIGRYFSGYDEKWNWLSFYASAGYTYSDLANVGFNISADGASSTGVNTSRFGFFPSVSGKWMLNHLSFMRDVSSINDLTLWADYGKTGNSRFSNNYGRYYYVSSLYQGIAGIIRANVPNTEIKWENNTKLNVGVKGSFFNHRLNASFALYDNRATDVLMARSESSLYGTGVHYSNDAAINSRGFDASLQVYPVYTKNFKWIVGGKLTRLVNKVGSLGTTDEFISTLSDNASIITRVGEDPYSFYGYEADGVWSTTLEAMKAHEGHPLRNRNGVEFKAGDVRYVDQNKDGVIDDADRIVLGSATPDFYGSAYNRFEYRGFALDFNFVYSIGNEAYNAVRRIAESSYDFSNQSSAVIRRWTMDGQITDMPRAKWNDQVGNNDFSSRWIEDASYLKLRDVTLSYSFSRTVWNLFHGGTLYVTGQNLWCLTDYLGSDPEFSYSYNAAMQGVDYAKVALPRTVKVGVNLQF